MEYHTLIGIFSFFIENESNGIFYSWWYHKFDKIPSLDCGFGDFSEVQYKEYFMNDMEGG